jgi:hypothetical protein
MTLVEAIKREIREAAETYDAALRSGTCKDYAEYRHAAGVIQGLTLAENRLIDLVQRMERDRD